MKTRLYYLLLLLSLSIVFGCSQQKKLTRTYNGKTLAFLKEEFGKPKTIFDRGDEKVYVYEKVEELRSTEISQAKLTLDPMVSPMVKKTERFYFTIKDGKVVKSELELEYER